jgi:hypothetical protein
MEVVLPRYKKRPAEITEDIVPLLSSGNQALQDEFDWAMNINRPGDAAKMVSKFCQLRTRPAGHTDVVVTTTC